MQSISILREGWEAQCYYSGRGERRSMTTQEEVGGGCNSKRCCLMHFCSIIQIILIGFSTDLLNAKILALGRGVSSFFFFLVM